MRAFSTAILFGLAASAMAVPGIILVGDSTVTANKGWGTGFCADTTGLAQCTNLAVGGTTTVSWQAQPQFKTMLSKCKTANTYALIQFGHNDQKTMNTAKFSTNLVSLVNKIKSAGCAPVLMTSLARRTFSSERATRDTLGPYSAETIKVASNMKLPLLPLLADSLAYLNKLGKTNAAKFDFESGDSTHLNALGTKYFGRIAADEVKAKVSALSSHIRADAALSKKIAAGTL
ncbi:SGNH hydrolase-type esterase domain-containing protein [Rhizoctonia solani]|nr:SGNH hydrolase-type esterase domain-containing protein [Rhizoctonia solani]